MGYTLGMALEYADETQDPRIAEAYVKAVKSIPGFEGGDMRAMCVHDSFMHAFDGQGEMVQGFARGLTDRCLEMIMKHERRNRAVLDERKAIVMDVVDDSVAIATEKGKPTVCHPVVQIPDLGNAPLDERLKPHGVKSFGVLDGVFFGDELGRHVALLEVMAAVREKTADVQSPEDDIHFVAYATALESLRTSGIEGESDIFQSIVNKTSAQKEAILEALKEPKKAKESKKP